MMSVQRELAVLLVVIGCLSHISCARHVLSQAPGKDPLLIVSATGNGDVVAYNITTGAYVKVFIPRGTGGLVRADTFFLRAKDKYLYVTNYTQGDTRALGSVLRFTKSGKFVDVFTSGFDLNYPYGAAWDATGKRLFVCAFGIDKIVLYDENGAFQRVVAQGDGTSASAQGPNALLAEGNYLYVTTQGSSGNLTSGEPDFIYSSALLKVDITTGTTVLAAIPDPAPLATFGFVSLLGIRRVPGSWVGYAGGDVLITSDFSGGIRYYAKDTFALIRTIPTVVPGIDAFYGNFVIYNGDIYLAAFNSDDSTGNLGYVLRYNLLTGAEKPAPGQAGAIFIGPDSRIPRAIGMFLI